MVWEDGSPLAAQQWPWLKTSKLPWTDWAVAVAVSVTSMTTLIPTAASSAWMNCARRRKSVWLRVSRCTVGFGKPDLATSALASFGSYGVHVMLGSNQKPSAGAISVQLG